MARPKPSGIPPERMPPKKIPPTPEQIAKAAVARRPKVIGTDRVEVTFRFTLPRAVMERLTARAIREGRSVSVAAELLERSASPTTGSSARTAAIRSTSR